MSMKIIHKNKKEDIKLIIDLGANYHGEDIVLTFSAGQYGLNKFVCSYVGGVQTNCVVNNSTVLCLLDNHGLSLGVLSVEIDIRVPDTQMPDGDFRHVTRKIAQFVLDGEECSLELTNGESDYFPIEAVPEAAINLLSTVIKGDPGKDADIEGCNAAIASAKQLAADVSEAEGLRAQAEQQRKKAETARIQAETERTEVETARRQAETIRSQSETARVSKENDRQDAEEVRKAREIERLLAENARTQAENARTEAESARDEAERRRTNAEQLRYNAEEERKEAEQIRIDNENDREDEETKRYESEQQRQQNETERQSAEQLRQQEETRRKQTEAVRTEAETTRTENESGRQDAENRRTENETLRQQAETVRQDNETKRQNAEAVRIENNKACVAATEQAVSAVEAANNANEAATEAVTNANTAAQSANEAADRANEAADLVYNGPDEVVAVALYSAVEGVSTAGLDLYVYINDNSEPLIYTTDANGMATFRVTKGLRYDIVFPDITGCAPIGRLSYTAALATRGIEVTYREYVVASTERVTIAFRKYPENTTWNGGEVYADGVAYVTIDGEETMYHADNGGMIVFEVPIGKEYKVRIEKPDDLHLLTGVYSATYTAVGASRFIPVSFHIYLSSFLIVDSDGGEWTMDGWEEAGKDASEAKLLHVATEELLAVGCDFFMSLDMMAYRKYDTTGATIKTMSWAAQNVEFTSIPLNSNSPDKDYYYDGLTATNLIVEEGLNRGIATDCHTTTLRQTFNLGLEVLKGFTPSYGQWAVMIANYTYINSIVSAMRPDGDVITKFWGVFKGTSSQSSASYAWYVSRYFSYSYKSDGYYAPFCAYAKQSL